MKVIAFNGSPRPKGNTWHALSMVVAELEQAGISTEIVQVGNKLVNGCLACGKCYKMKNEQCVQTNDEVNQWIQQAKEADGLLLGSPTHYAALGGALKCFLDRLFYVAGANGGLLRHKVGAGVAAVRRSGGIPVVMQLNIYFMYAEMLIPGSNYWNVIHGTQPGEVKQDAEGVQIMRMLGKNMAWLMQLKEHGKNAVTEPAPEGKVAMNFIR
ncbi:MAG: flavodoxin family protein [Desulfobulbus sp.]|jgi:multimeric flavodoxin WrbA